MSLVKRMMERDEELGRLAISLLLETRALEECEIHAGTYYEGDGDVQEAYRLANARISRREIELPDGVSRRKFTDIIKSAHQDNSGADCCYSCENNMRD